jgi:hypothetical protein
MTRARALKQIIRARAAKTGERYTTARRHVLKDLSRPAVRPAAAAPESMPARGASKAASTKGSVSDATSIARTGHGLDHWFAILDRFGGAGKGHTASARHLAEDHGVPGWHAQGITVAYERARGLRTINQRTSGDYEMSVTKTVTADTAAVVRSFTNPRRRAKWLASADAELGAALTAALRAKSSKGFVVRADRQGRYRYKWGATTVQVYLLPKGDGRTSVVVTNLKLESAQQLEERRGQWRAALAALSRLFIDE